MTEISEAAKARAAELTNLDGSNYDIKRVMSFNIGIAFARFIQQVSDVAKEAAGMAEQGCWQTAAHDLAPFILSEPADEDVLAVRRVLHAHQRAMTPPDSGWGDMSYLKGSYDHLPVFQAALEEYRQMKRGLEIRPVKS